MLLVAIGVSACAARDDRGVLEFDGVLAGRDLSSATAANPVPIHHEELTELSLTMVNRSSEPVTVAHVRLEGELLDLIFLTYDTGLHETIAPGERRTVTFPIDFFDLGGQAHGLLRTQIRLYDADRTPLASRDLVVDGRGSPWATMATFNLVLVGVAAVSLGWNLYRLAQRRLPANRFARGLVFFHGGAATGLAISAAASTLRIFPLATVGWIMVTIVVSIFAFALGYVSPGADLEELDGSGRIDGFDGSDGPGLDGGGIIDLDRIDTPGPAPADPGAVGPESPWPGAVRLAPPGPGSTRRPSAARVTLEGDANPWPPPD